MVMTHKSCDTFITFLGDSQHFKEGSSISSHDIHSKGELLHGHAGVKGNN